MDLVRRDAYLALRRILPKQAALQVRRIASFPATLFVSRSYVEVRGRPALPTT